ncbi:hypothetical protein Tco_1313869 [Tanacetum coccineum]
MDDKGKNHQGHDEGKDDDLRKSYKEVLKSPSPSAANQGEWEMPSKCPELARRFANRVQKTVIEMMKRVDDFVKSKEAYKSTKLPKGEHPKKVQAIPLKGEDHPILAMEAGIRGWTIMAAMISINDTSLFEPQIEGMTTIGAAITTAKKALHQRLLSPKETTRGSIRVREAQSLDQRRMRDLRGVSSTVHAMVKFPTPKGIATLIARTKPMYECRWSERQVVENEKGHETTTSRELEGPEEEVLVNPAYPKQSITIGIQFSPKCRGQLISLLKKNMDVFAWEPSDMVGVPIRVIKHALNVNASVSSMA